MKTTRRLEEMLNEINEMKAKCGHIDPLGYLGNTVCGKCARRSHRRAMGRR